jgi:hypothetical protein
VKTMTRASIASPSSSTSNTAASIDASILATRQLPHLIPCRQ